MKSQKSFKFYATIITLWTFIMFIFQTGLKMDILNVILPVIEETKGWTIVEINNVVSMAGYIGLAVGFIFTSLYMKFGVKKIFPIYAAIAAGGTIVMGFADNIATFAIALTISNLAIVPLTVGPIAIIGNWFVSGKGRILGLATMGAPFCTAAFIPFATWILNQFGFTVLYVLNGVVLFVSAVGFMLLVPTTPEEVGYFPDNGTNPLEANLHQI